MAGRVAGLWTFTDTATGNKTTQVVAQDPSGGALKRAFDAAQTTLGGVHSNLIGQDPRGNKFRYDSVRIAKKFDR